MEGEPMASELPEIPDNWVPPAANQIIKKVSTSEWKTTQKKFRQNIERTRAFALGDTEQIMGFIPLNPGERVASFKAKTKGYRGLVTKVMGAYLDGIAGLPVRREVPSVPDFDLTPFERNLDVHKIQMKAEIGGTCAVRPFINMNGDVSYELFEAWQLCPLTQGSELIALGVSYGKENEWTEVWTPSFNTVFYKSNVQWSDFNPYGLIPFSIFRAAVNDKDWFGVSELTPVVTNNIAVIKLLTDLQQLARDQSYSWLFYKGPRPEKDDDPSGTSAPLRSLQVGPDRMTMLDEDADVFTVTPDASINEIQAAADLLAEKTYEDACVASAVQSAQAESGYALRVKKAPYLNKMKTKRVLFKEADQRLMEISALIHEVGLTGAATLNDEFKVSTSFDERSLTPVDPNTEMQDTAFLLNQRAMSRIDLIMSENQVNREEALAIAQRIDEENSTQGAEPTNQEN
jgi:hypothetical protein